MKVYCDALSEWKWILETKKNNKKQKLSNTILADEGKFGEPIG